METDTYTQADCAIETVAEDKTAECIKTMETSNDSAATTETNKATENETEAKIKIEADESNSDEKSNTVESETGAAITAEAMADSKVSSPIETCKAAQMEAEPKTEAETCASSDFNLLTPLETDKSAPSDTNSSVKTEAGTSSLPAFNKTAMPKSRDEMYKKWLESNRKAPENVPPKKAVPSFSFIKPDTIKEPAQKWLGRIVPVLGPLFKENHIYGQLNPTVRGILKSEIPDIHLYGEFHITPLYLK